MQLIWEEFLKIIKEEAGTQIVETWFKAVKIDRWNPETKTVFLYMPNIFVSNWIQEHYTDLIKMHLSRLFHVDTLRLFFLCKGKEQQKTKTIIPASPLQKQIIYKQASPQGKFPLSPPSSRTTFPVVKRWGYGTAPSKKRRTRPQLNEHYTFETFVVGPSNSLAHAAAFAVTQNLGRVYNPLFIYGGTGLGKTHLLHAIGNSVRKCHATASISYISSDQFMNEFINAITLDKTRQFREKYQRVDLLLLDDIQFFSRKEQMQEIFFHIFNLLYQQRKQMVLSSDTLPNDIAGLQNRLKSRLQSGLVADVQKPNLETKMAILKKKALAHGMLLGNEIISFIASQEVPSVRELEGYLIRLAAFSSLTHQPITLSLAEHVFTQLHAKEKEKRHFNLDKIMQTIATHYDIAIKDLRSEKRSKEIVFARQITFYLMKKLTQTSLQTIGIFVGGRNHSTVLHATRKIKMLEKQDTTLAKTLRKFEKTIARTAKY